MHTVDAVVLMVETSEHNLFYKFFPIIRPSLSYKSLCQVEHRNKGLKQSYFTPRANTHLYN